MAKRVVKTTCANCNDRVRVTLFFDKDASAADRQSEVKAIQDKYVCSDCEASKEGQ